LNDMYDINSELFFQIEEGESMTRSCLKGDLGSMYGNMCLVIELLIIGIHCLHIALIVVT